ncbi:MAG: hypothetical protein LBS46_00060 [Dysgonamonadaceae bacterium]|jgi:hypothetical protein|nr:hypothetical protein [Dysgonamonadaceae bacterium]
MDESLTVGNQSVEWIDGDFNPAMCVLAAVFVWKWVPETKGKTLEKRR